MFRLSLALVDLDGTLIDHTEGIHAACAQACQRAGVHVPSEEIIRGSVGTSAEVWLRRLVPAAAVAPVLYHYQAHLRRYPTAGLRWLPGAREFLPALRQAGMRAVIFTNKPGAIARLVMESAGLADECAAILGVGDLPGRKPEPRFTRRAIQRVGGKLKETCLIGDSLVDVAAARGVGIPCLAVATGTQDAAILRQAGAAYVADNLPALAGKLTGQ